MIDGKRQVRRERPPGNRASRWCVESAQLLAPPNLIIRHVRKAGIVCGRVDGNRLSNSPCIFTQRRASIFVNRTRFHIQESPAFN